MYIRTKTCLGRVEVPNTALVKIAEWDSPRAPELKPDDFKLVELPRVTVRYARFDRKYAEAFGKVLLEALTVYESLGFKMPRNIELEGQIDPSGTQLWTDGESQIFLHLQSKEVLAPASRTGVFNLHGMCHELGRIAMYRNLKPDGPSARRRRGLGSLRRQHRCHRGRRQTRKNHFAGVL